MQESERAQMMAAREQLERLEGFMREDPANLKLLEDGFRAALRCGDWDRARIHLVQAQSLRPDDAYWPLREADFWLAQRRYKEARTVLERLEARAQPGSELAAVVIENLAFIDFSLCDDAACLAKLGPLMTPHSASAPGSMSGSLQQLWLRSLHRHGASARSCQWATDAELAGNLSPEGAGVASLAAIDHQDFAAAQRWLRLASASQTAPSMEVMATQATLALASHSAKDAQQFADQALGINPKDGRAWSIRGFSSLLAGNLGTAATDFGHALKFMPGHVGTWHGQGWTQVLMRDLAAAQGSFTSALELDRNLAESHGALAVVLALQKQPQRARQHIELARRLDRAGLSSRYAEAILSGEVQDAQAIQRLAQRLVGGVKGPLGDSVADWLSRSTDDGLAGIDSKQR